MAQHHVRESVSVAIEMRRRAALQLEALELRHQERVAAIEAELAAAGGEASAGAAVAEAVARHAAEAEPLRAKVASHSSEVASLQTKLIRTTSGDEAVAKLDALTSLKHARAVLRAAFPQARLAAALALHRATTVQPPSPSPP